MIIVAASILPLGLGHAAGDIGPYFVNCVIFYWAVRAPQHLPPVALFLTGLLIDLITAGPIGFWPLIYLCIYGLSLFSPRLMRRKRFLVLCVGFAAVNAAAGVLAWGLGCLYFGAIIDVAGPVRAVAVTSACFPLAALLFKRLVFVPRKGAAENMGSG